MNLLASYKWIKEHVNTKVSPEEFAARLSLCGPSIERIYPQGENLEKIVVGEILKIKPHPNADKLRIVETRIGRDSKDIVCGGINLREGMKVAVALSGSKVRWHGEGELIELGPAEIRGVKSDSMIAAANEIGLYDYFPHADREIMDISSIEAAPGTPLREALGLDDDVFDVEITTNRPDAFSIVGLAREASVILDAPFLSKPSVIATPTIFNDGGKQSKIAASRQVGTRDDASIDIKIDAPKLCPRYQAAVLKNVNIRPSPWWMQKRLISAGIRPISNIVDITNYVMLEFGQSLHAFDADKLEKIKKNEDAWQIVVRNAKKGEKIQALDGKNYELNESNLVIADTKNPVAIAGVMGGEVTGITESTRTVIFESAIFDPVSIRRTARGMNLLSDASLRYEKGLSTESTTASLNRAIELAEELADAVLVSPLFDKRAAPYKPQSFYWDPEETVRAIGVSISTPEMKRILEKLGFEVQGSGKQYKVIVPYWRDHDIEDGRDFTEEIARVYGYHKLPSVIPSGALPLRPEENILANEDLLRNKLKGAGLTEVYSYSFVSKELLEKALGEKTASLDLQNPLTSDLATMRITLVPSLLQIVSENENQFSNSGIFEVANVYLPRRGDLPQEISMLGLTLWGESPKGELFFKAKGMLESIVKEWNIDGINIVNKDDSDFGHPGRSAKIHLHDRLIGFIGEIHPQVLEKFGIKNRVAIIHVNIEELMKERRGWQYTPISDFPPVRRDISFFVLRKTAYESIIDLIKQESILSDAELFDVYSGKGIPEDKKSMALHLTFSDSTRTLTSEEVDKAFNNIVQLLEKGLKAEVRKV